MKLYILDICDGNGARLVADYSKDALAQQGQDWFTKRRKGIIPSPEVQAMYDERMDKFMDGQHQSFYDGASIQLREVDLDVTGIVDVLEDALHTLGKLNRLVQMRAPLTENAAALANSSYLTADQAINHTLLKLKGQP